MRWLLIGGSLLLVAGGVLGAAIGPGEGGRWLLPAHLACLPFGAGVVLISGARNPLAFFLAAGAALVGTYGLTGLVPALALDQSGERISCTVVRQDVESGGRGTFRYHYVARCPGDERLAIENAATTRELDRRWHPVGERVEVVRTPGGPWAPDTADSVRQVLGSWYRWAAVSALGVVLLWTFARSLGGPDRTCPGDAPTPLPPTHR